MTATIYKNLEDAIADRAYSKGVIHDVIKHPSGAMTFVYSEMR